MRRALMVQFASDRSGSAVSGELVVRALQRCGMQVVVAFAHEGPMVEVYRAMGCRTEIMPHKNWLRRSTTPSFIKDVLAERRSAQALTDLARQVKPDVGYVNTVASLAGALSFRTLGIPFVWHLRELFQDVGGEMLVPRWVRPMVGPVISRLATRVVANSRFVAGNILGRRLARDATVVPNAVEDVFFDRELPVAEARRRMGLPPDRRLIGIPGTLRPVKGHQFFFEALGGWLVQHPDVHVAITGRCDTAHGVVVRQQVATLGLDAQVTFTGEIQDMLAFYRACDLICVPSRAEPFGRVVIEAFAMGVPVVATGVGGIQEVIRDGDNGRWCEYGNAAELREAIRQCLEEPDLAKELACEARDEALVTYSQSAHQNRLVEQVRTFIPG